VRSTMTATIAKDAEAAAQVAAAASVQQQPT
jgi:hypothetical protein